MYCLSMARTSWDEGLVQSNAYNDVKDDLEEKGSYGARNYRSWRDGLSLATFDDLPVTYMIILAANVAWLVFEIDKREPVSETRRPVWHRICDRSMLS